MKGTEEGSSGLFPGRIIKNRYRLVESLGTRGGYSLFSAYDLLLEQNVVVKALDGRGGPGESSAGKAAASSLLAAARRVARLQHPGLVLVLDFGMEGEAAFVVEEDSGGALLSDKLAERERMPLRGFLNFATLASEALEALHRSGGAHGDIRPEKVLLLPGGGVKLADAGYPRPATGGGLHPVVPGPPAQAEDIRALGALFYRCLTGKGLDPGLLQGESATPRLDLGEEIPPKVARILEKALSRGEHARFRDAGELRRELEAALRRESPLQAKQQTGAPTGRESQPGKRPRILGLEKRWLLAASGALVLAFAALLAWLVVLPLLRTKVEVPNLLRKNVEEARREAESRGFRFREGGAEYSAYFEADRVINQTPAAGKRVAKGSEITVVVSRGPLTVPYLRGLLLEDARAALKREGLGVGEVSYEDTDEYKPGVVLGSDPPEGTRLSGGETVNLVVSR